MPAVRAGDAGTLQFPFRLLSEAEERNVYKRFEERFALEREANGSGAQLPSSTLISARCENISCCTSVAAVQPPVVRRTGGFLRKGMTTTYVDSRKRVAGSDSDFEVDLGESLHLQSDARLAVCKIRLANSFVSTDRGRYLYWVDAALGTLNWALLPEGAYTGPRLAAWITSNFATATYSETTNSLSVAYDGNRLILNDLGAIP